MQQLRLPPAAAASQDPQPDGSSSSSEGASLASEFGSYVNEQGGLPPLLRDRRPTHLMSPVACIAAQMEALQVRACSWARWPCAGPEEERWLLAVDSCPLMMPAWRGIQARPAWQHFAAAAFKSPSLYMLPHPCPHPSPTTPQRNDYPDRDAGVQTAFMFSMQQGAEELLSAQVRAESAGGKDGVEGDACACRAPAERTIVAEIA